MPLRFRHGFVPQQIHTNLKQAEAQRQREISFVPQQIHTNLKHLRRRRGGGRVLFPNKFTPISNTQCAKNNVQKFCSPTNSHQSQTLLPLFNSMKRFVPQQIHTNLKHPGPLWVGWPVLFPNKFTPISNTVGGVEYRVTFCSPTNSHQSQTFSSFFLTSFLFCSPTNSHQSQTVGEAFGKGVSFVPQQIHTNLKHG